MEPTVENLIYKFDRKVHEEAPFTVFSDFGVDEEVEGEYLTDDFYTIDPECICEAAYYEKIFKRFIKMSGVNPLSDLEVSLDEDSQKGEVSFVAEGKTYRWPIVINDDWWDPGVIHRFLVFLNKFSSPRKFYIFGELHLDGVIACLTEKQAKAINGFGGIMQFREFPSKLHSDLYAYAALAAPLLGTRIEKLVAGAFSFSPDYLFFITMILVGIPLVADARIINTVRGGNMLARLVDFIVPVYYYKRAKLTGYGIWMSAVFVVFIFLP